ncbi:MAG: SDR family oxidoreductase [Gammaproteobacteria bacterium]|nr:SDR family oxidoreductase [Gammaproteobacteria bacterium]
MNRVAGKVAIVTGAARGLGRADALLLAEEGARVVATDIDAEAGRSLGSTPGIDFLAHDVSREEDWRRVVAYAMGQYGRLDVLVNNAGVIHVGDPIEFDMGEWRHMSAVNIDGAMLGCRHALPEMINGGSGSIINMASIGARAGLYFYAGYCATKGAIAAYTKSVAVYCAQNRLNIRCNSIHPGGIDTPINAGLAAEMAVKLPRMRIPPKSPVSEDGPKMRFGEPQDVAWMVLYLASDESKFMNGSEIYIDNTSTITAAAIP